MRKLTQGCTACLKHKCIRFHSLCCARGASPGSDCLADDLPGSCCLPPRNMSQIGSCQASSGGWATCQVLSLHQASLITAQLLVLDENHSAQEASGTAEHCSVPSAALGIRGARGLVPAPTFLPRQLRHVRTQKEDNSFPDFVLSQETGAVALEAAARPRGLSPQDYSRAECPPATHRPRGGGQAVTPCPVSLLQPPLVQS